MDHIVIPEWDGKSLLNIIRYDLRLSRAALKHLKFIENGIMLNGTHATVRAVAHTGDILSLMVESFDTPSEKLVPVELPLSIAYEDEDIVIPDKPVNMPTHPSHDHYRDTVANALAFRYEKQGIPFVFRPVNRLDRNTSGLLMIAKNRTAAAILSEDMKQGRIKKRYIAILEGTLPSDEGRIDTYMKRTDESIIVRRNCTAEEGGDRALTEYRVIAKTNTHSLVCASPITGRTHQLRVHFSGLGCPIMGDDIYGTPSDKLSAHALHSYYLEFYRPADSIPLTVTAPPRREMLELCEELFGEEGIRALNELCSVQN